MPILIRLPLPHKALHPNGRANRHLKARETRIYREHARRETFTAAAQIDFPFLVTAYSLTHFYKQNRPDADNVLGSMKAGIDGICDALGVNDRDLEVRGVSRIKDPQPRVEVLLHIEDLS